MHRIPDIILLAVAANLAVGLLWMAATGVARGTIGREPRSREVHFRVQPFLFTALFAFYLFLSTAAAAFAVFAFRQLVYSP